MTSTKMMVKTVEKFVVDNAPALLTAVGATGTVATAYLTHRGTFKAALILNKEDEKRRMFNQDPISRTETFKLTWLCYVPATAAGVGTLAAIIFANRISSKRAAALAAAYAISEGRFSEYKDKVKEKMGITKEQKLTDELAQERMDKNPPGPNILILGNGDVLCKDEFSGRYFKSSMEAIKRAENDTNFEIIHSNYATVSDFYDRVGLPATSSSESFGWNSPDRLELAWTTIVSPDGQPCIAFDMNAKPVREHGSCP